VKRMNGRTQLSSRAGSRGARRSSWSLANELDTAWGRAFGDRPGDRRGLKFYENGRRRAGEKRANPASHRAMKTAIDICRCTVRPRHRAAQVTDAQSQG